MKHIKRIFRQFIKNFSLPEAIKNPVIRLFYFMVSMFLLLIWNLYKKAEFSFKKFVIVMYETIKEDTTRAEI